MMTNLSWNGGRQWRPIEKKRSFECRSVRIRRNDNLILSQSNDMYVIETQSSLGAEIQNGNDSISEIFFRNTAGGEKDVCKFLWDF